MDSPIPRIVTPPIHIVDEDPQSPSPTSPPTPPPTMTRSSPVTASPPSDYSSPPNFPAAEGDGNHLDLGRTGLESK